MPAHILLLLIILIMMILLLFIILLLLRRPQNRSIGAIESSVDTILNQGGFGVNQYLQLLRTAVLVLLLSVWCGTKLGNCSGKKPGPAHYIGDEQV